MLNDRPSRRRRQRGLSIVELMVGVAVGLLVVAASALVVSTQLVENRKLLIETQIQQDLRATADIVTRELRRAGAWNYSALPGANPVKSSLWWYGTGGVVCNLYATVAPSTTPSSEVDYRYARYSGQVGPLGFKLDNSSGVGVIRFAMTTSTGPDNTTCAPANTPGNWQDLSDASTVNITGFTISPQPVTPVQIPCPKVCSDGTTACWPTISVRELKVTIQGQAVSDHTVNRSITSLVRLRNDWVQFNDPVHPTQSCPT